MSHAVADADLSGAILSTILAIIADASEESDGGISEEAQDEISEYLDLLDSDGLQGLRAELSGDAERLAQGGEWSRYEGPHGGHGWKNAATGEVVYQEAMPGSGSSETKPDAGPKKAGKVKALAALLHPRSILNAIRGGANAVRHPVETVKRVKGAAINRFHKLRDRYGTAGALAIAGAYAGYYTIAAHNPIMFAIPVPLTATVLGSAEAIRYGVQKFKGQQQPANARLSQDGTLDYLAEAKGFIAALAEAAGEKPPPIDDDILSQVLESLLEQGPEQLAHAPAGGVTIGGTEYFGGQFIPDEALEQATDEERSKVEGKGNSDEDEGVEEEPEEPEEDIEDDPEAEQAWAEYEESHAAWRQEVERIEAEHAQVVAEWRKRDEERDARRDKANANHVDDMLEAHGRPDPADAPSLEDDHATDGTYADEVAGYAAGHVQHWEKLFGSDGELAKILSEIGGSDKEIARVQSLSERGKAAIERAVTRYQSAAARHAKKATELLSHRVKMDDEPEEPEEPEELSEDDGYDAEEVAKSKEDIGKWSKTHAKWEKDHAAWEKLYEREVKLEEDEEDLRNQVADAVDDLDSAWGDAVERIEAAAEKISDRVVSDIDDESAADLGVDDPEYPEEPEEPDSDGPRKPQQRDLFSLDSIRERVRKLADQKYPRRERLAQEPSPPVPQSVRREVEYDADGRVVAFTDTVDDGSYERLSHGVLPRSVRREFRYADSGDVSFTDIVNGAPERLSEARPDVVAAQPTQPPPAPTINVQVNIPQQEPPTVHVAGPTIHIPEAATVAPPVVNVQVSPPAQEPPVVNVTVEQPEPKKIVLTRDRSGTLTGAEVQGS